MITEKASAASYFTGVGVGLLGLAFNEWMLLLGVVATVGTFLVNSYFKYKEDKRAERESQARIEAINNKK